MFIDYYAILEVEISATFEEIKKAFKDQAMKWHPDKNYGVNTNERMQLIIEAKFILLDSEARTKYNIEYLSFKKNLSDQIFTKPEFKEKDRNTSESYETQDSKSYQYDNYTALDDILNKWMNNAKKQAANSLNKTIEDFRGMVSAGAKAAIKEGGNAIVYQIIFGIIFMFILALSKSCH